MVWGSWLGGVGVQVWRCGDGGMVEWGLWGGGVGMEVWWCEDGGVGAGGRLGGWARAGEGARGLSDRWGQG